MVSLRDLLPMVLAHPARLAHLLQVRGPFAVACHRPQRRIMWHQAHITLNRRSSHLSQCRHSNLHLHHHLLLTSPSSLSSLNPTASLIRTTAHMLVLAVSHRHHLRHPLVWLDPLASRHPDPSHRTGAQEAHHRRCAPLLKTGLVPHATDTRDRTSITLIPLPAVVSPVVLPHRPLLLLRRKQLHGIVKTVRPLHPRNVTGSGRKARSCRVMMRSARNSRNLTAVVRHLPITRRRHKFPVRALKLPLTLDALTMATTHQRLLITPPRWRRSVPHSHRHHCPGCRKHQHRQKKPPVLSTMSQLLAT